MALLYGRGLKFPFDVGPTDLVTAEDRELAESDLLCAFHIDKGDLPWDMEVGEDWEGKLDDPVDAMIKPELELAARSLIAYADDRFAPKLIEAVDVVDDPLQPPSRMQLKVLVDVRVGVPDSPALRDVEASIDFG
jgi:hypothetical protein